jgi:hypothetical protein
VSDIIPPPETVTDEFGNTTDDQFNEDQDELQKAFAAETGLSQSDIQTINAAETALGQLDLTTLVTLAQMDALDSIETYYNPIAETFSDDDSSYDEQKSVTEDQKDKVAQQERSVRGKMARRIVLFLLGITVGEALVAGIAMLRLKHEASASNAVPLPASPGRLAASRRGATLAAASSDDNPLALTPGAEAQAIAALNVWRARTDADHWQSIAAYVGKNNPSLQGMMVAMGYIKNWISADTVTWSATEKSGAIEALVKAATTGHLSAMFATVATMQHAGQPLQRAVAADLCEHALAQMLAAAQGAASG